MQVQLQDRRALLVGDGLQLGAAIADALAASGAVVEGEKFPERLDLLVTFSQHGGLELDRLATVCRDAAAVMSEGSRILNVASVTGLVPMRGDPSAPLQAAALALTRALALEFAHRGILVNALAVVPGAETERRMVSHIPGGQPPKVADVARAALFLLDPDNTYTTGHTLVADGGWSIGYARDF